MQERVRTGLISRILEFRSLKALADGKNISFSILEPGRLGATGDCNAVPHLDAGHVVLFEHHASGLEIGHLRFETSVPPHS